MLEPETAPQVLREDLMQFVLAVAATGFRPQELEFLDAPPEFAVARAQEQLRRWGALDRENRLTPFGRRLFEVAVDAALARLLLEAPPELRRDVADLAAALESRAPLFRGGPAPEGAGEEEEKPTCDGVRLIRALRRGRPESDGLHPEALAECRRVADQLRALYNLPPVREDAQIEPDRQALLAHLLRAWPERAYVRRRGGDAWGNGRNEVTLAGARPARGRRGARRAPDDNAPQAAVVLDVEAIGDRGLRTQLRGRYAMPCAVGDLLAAGLGTPRAEGAAVEEGRVVALVAIEYAGREIGREERSLSGELLRQTLAQMILAGRVLPGAGEALGEAVAAWNLHCALNGREGDVVNAGAWLAQRLAQLGVDGPEDWALLSPADVRFPELDAATRAELDRRYPRSFSSGLATYAVEYDPRARTITLRWQGGRRNAPLSESALPRWSGWMVKLEERGRLVTLRER